MNLFSFFLFIFIFYFFVFFYLNLLGYNDNYIPANLLLIFVNIIFEWYFLPIYAILKSIFSKLENIITTISAILILLILSIINTFFIYSNKFCFIFSIVYWLVFSF